MTTSRPDPRTDRAASDAAWRAVLDEAAAPYRSAGRFALHFAKGKLGIDPVFRHLLEEGLIAPRARVLDLGCGQGVLASLLCAASSTARSGGWPAGWAPAPIDARVTGVELMRRDVARAEAALGEAARFVCADIRHAPFPPSDAVVILDVLHYFPIDEQDAVLGRARAALAASGGRLLLRVGDAAAGRRFMTSQWVDRLVTAVRGHRVLPTFVRPLADWQARLETLGFRLQTRPMSRGTPFANVLLVADAPLIGAGRRRAGGDEAGRPSAARHPDVGHAVTIDGTAA